ncbi:MAG: molybdate ABC transporter permease subunit, partial [Isosphaeraceae bacterium]|nr:molybdate ABC transporter permease subunit [Isosphaeraceae bacterium]
MDLTPFWLSLRVAGLATLAIIAVGIPTALVLARGRFPGKGLLAGVLVLPMVLPPTVLGYYLLELLGRRAPLGMWLERSLGIT